MVRPRDPRRRRSTGSSLLVEPSSPTSNQIPLNVLPRSFIQSSSSESSQSSSSTPPSSAEGATTETRPYLENGNPVTSAATPPSSSEVHSTTSNPTQTPISTSIVQSPVAGDNVNRAVQAEQEQQSSPVTIASRPWWLGVGRWISKRSWFQSTLGISSLIFTMISLFIYGLRSYEMAKWSERNDLMQMCAGLIQANVSGGPSCERVLREGPTLPPYGKRATIYSPGVGAYGLVKRATSSTQYANRNDGIAHTIADYGFGGIGNWALAILSALAMAGGFLAFLRSRRPEEAVFTSPARSEGPVRVTGYRPEGPGVVEPMDPVKTTRHPQPRDPAAGEVRRRLIQDRGSLRESIEERDVGSSREPNLRSGSEDTLVGAWTESNSRKVSIATPSDDFKVHEGLTELKPSGDTKNFRDPTSRAFDHLSPWKSTHSDDEDDELPHILDPEKEGTAKRAIVGMGAGGAALAHGKDMEDKIAQALRKKERVPQQAGDCLAGEVTNEQ